MLQCLFPDQYQFAPGGLEARSGPWVLSLRTAINDAEQLVEQRLPAWLELRIIDERPVLFAFASEPRREMFLQLLTVSGIGPESALLILDLGSNQEILLAVASDDYSFFRQVPGIGPARIKALTAIIKKKYPLPDPLPIPVVQWRLLAERYPELAPSDPRLAELAGKNDQQALSAVASWELDS